MAVFHHSVFSLSDEGFRFRLAVRLPQFATIPRGASSRDALHVLDAFFCRQQIPHHPSLLIVSNTTSIVYGFPLRASSIVSHNVLTYLPIMSCNDWRSGYLPQSFSRLLVSISSFSMCSPTRFVAAPLAAVASSFPPFACVLVPGGFLV